LLPKIAATMAEIAMLAPIVIITGTKVGCPATRARATRWNAAPNAPSIAIDPRTATKNGTPRSTASHEIR
jgi:hypothetical protein